MRTYSIAYNIQENFLFSLCFTIMMCVLDRAINEFEDTSKNKTFVTTEKKRKKILRVFTLLFFKERTKQMLSQVFVCIWKRKRIKNYFSHHSWHKCVCTHLFRRVCVSVYIHLFSHSLIYILIMITERKELYTSIHARL